MKNLIKILLLLTFLVTLPVGCKKEEEKQATNPKDKSNITLVQKESFVDSLKSTLLKKLPVSTAAFAYLDLNSPSYARLANSPWYGEGFSQSISALKEVDKKFVELLESFKNSGLDFEDEKRRKEIFSKIVIFLGKAPSLSEKLDMGLIVEPTKGVTLEKEVESLKKTLEEKGYESASLNLENGVKAYSFSPKLEEAADDTKTSQNAFFIALKDGLFLLSSKEKLINEVFSQSEEIAPILSNPELSKLSKEFPSKDNWYLFSFVDIESISKGIDVPNDVLKNLASNAVPVGEQEIPKTSEIPFISFATYSGMDSTPDGEIVIAYKPKTERQKKVFDILHNTSGAKLLDSVTSEVMLFASLDTKNFVEILDKVVMQEPNYEMKPEHKNLYDVIAPISRIGVSASVAPLGQSLLPLPDFVFSLQSSDVAKTKENLKTSLGKLASGGAQNFNVEWQTKEIEGLKAEYVLTPLGLGAFIVDKDSVVYVATSENRLVKELSGKTSIKSQFKSKANQLIRPNGNLFEVVVNMPQLADFLQNMVGIIGMYTQGNQNPGVEKLKEMLAQDKIDRIKKMGKMVTSILIDKEDQTIRVKSIYE